ncbi:MAG: hypothetical protein M1434_00640 [Chloroflexi bacterium]|nr:hypothetical protein [Chloroflexota bacterium]MCL5273240.1 hypothetical protein [Chloroflexota bacterium]
MAVLTRANQLIANGRPAEGAALLAGLARELENSNHPRRAANVHARAAHAYADGRDGAAALAHARSALGLFLQYRMARRAPVFFANITRKLNGGGFKAEAAALQSEFGAQIGALPAIPGFGAGQRRGQLPTNCPKCGAPMRADEADWVDANTVECDFCGSLIRSE